MRKLFLAAVAAGLMLTGPGRAAAQDNARAIVARAVQAYGGEARLARLRCARLTTRGTLQLAGAPAGFAAETSVELPGRIKNVLHCELQGQTHTVSQVIDGERVAVVVDGEVQKVKEQAEAELRELLYAEQVQTLLPLLRDPSYRLTPAGEEEVNRRPAVGIHVASPGHKDMTLHFDRETGLLVKARRRSLDPATLKDVLQEEYYGDYRATDGLQRPWKVVVFKDGRKFMEGEVVTIKYLDKLDDSLFAQP
jgi:hypothetical protein